MDELRRWSAEITFYGSDLELAFRRNGETIPATPSEYDLQKEQARSAVNESAEYLRAGIGIIAHITLFKTTKANGTVKDQTWYVELDERSGRYVGRR
jgi:hypothetical protein